MNYLFIQWPLKSETRFFGVISPVTKNRIDEGIDTCYSTSVEKNSFLLTHKMSKSLTNHYLHKNQIISCLFCYKINKTKMNKSHYLVSQNIDKKIKLSKWIYSDGISWFVNLKEKISKYRDFIILQYFILNYKFLIIKCKLQKE